MCPQQRLIWDPIPLTLEMIYIKFHGHTSNSSRDMTYRGISKVIIDRVTVNITFPTNIQTVLPQRIVHVKFHHHTSYGSRDMTCRLIKGFFLSHFALTFPQVLVILHELGLGTRHPIRIRVRNSSSYANQGQELVILHDLGVWVLAPPHRPSHP